MSANISASASQNATELPWPAPAKLNLMLRIVGRRADGYHELQTVFQFVDLCDELHFTVLDTPDIVRANALPGVAPEQDLAVRAARALQQAVGCRRGASIACSKRLPMGGGLGGGSSDAATTLVALNHHWQTGLDCEALCEIALPLGADVPVFVRGQAAWAEGVGERLTPVELPEPWYLLAVPACSVATGAVFSHSALTRNSRRITLSDFLDGEARNDCLPVVRAEYPAVADALDWLSQHAPARLTGTGACVFAEFAASDRAENARRSAPDGLEVHVVRGLNRSPLIERLARARGVSGQD